tara:strand:+ start:1104 stop:3296 length:2193 start_codon:yes stop_codon:yes gene_type:complete
MSCFLGLLWSQEALITGLLLNVKDQTPIHGANIYSEKLGIGVVSQVDGRFSINNLSQGKISFTISMIGFKDVKKSLFLDQDSYDIGKVLMLRDTIKIEEIVVDAHYELQPENFSSNIYIVGNQYHGNLKSSLALTLEEETGLSIRSMGQGTTQPVLRGYSGDRFLLTEGGTTAGDLSNTSIDHTVSMDMASFNKVRVIRGPEALLYGSNTIGGVIDVSRQVDSEARFKKTSLQAIFGTESSNSSLFGNVVCYVPLNYKHQLRFSLLSRNTGNQISPIGPLANTALSNHELTGSYSYFGKDYRATFSYEQLAMNYGIPGSPEGHISGVDIDMNKNTQKFNVHKDISFMGFQTLDIDQRFISYGHTESVKGSSYPSVILDQQIFSLQNTLKRPKVNVGSLFQYRNFQAGGFYWTPDTKELNIAIFGLYEREINDFIVQISSRAEYLAVTPTHSWNYLSNLDVNQVVERRYPIFASAIGVFRPWNNWRLSFGSMLTGRAPGIEDLYSDGPHLGTYAYEIGQPNLGLEKSIGIEASLEHHTQKSDIRLTGYQNYSPNFHISTKMGDGYQAGADYIEWGSGSSGWLYKYQMQGLEAKIYGIESDFNYSLTSLIKLKGSLSITRGKNISGSVPLSYMPPDKILFSTEYNLNQASFTIVIKKVFPQSRLGEFETKTEGYLLTDFNGSYTIYSSKVTHKVIFQIDNIFDEVYYNHLSKIKLIMPEKGRNINIQYRIVF